MKIHLIAFLFVSLAISPTLIFSQDQPPTAVNQQDEVVNLHLGSSTLPREVLQILRTGDKFETNRYVSRVFELHHTKGYEVLPFIRSIVDLEKGAVRSANLRAVDGEPARSFIHVITTPDQMESVAETVAMLDTPGLVNSQGSERRAIRLKYRLASDLGEVLKATHLTGQASVFADDLTNTLYFDDSESVIDATDAYVEFFDVPIPQVEFDVQIIELRESDTARVGLDWDAWKRSIGGQIGFTSTQLEGGSSFHRIDSLLTLDANVLANFLNYTVQSGTGRLVQRSRLNASNLEPAIISETKRVPHYDYSRSERTPVVLTESTNDYPGERVVAIAAPSHNRLVDISPGHEGIAIAIQPLIGTQTVTASIEIVVNTFIGFDQLNKPLLAEQKLQNRVTLQDGRQILLGTLERETRVDGRRGIPFLRDIPVLKYLFSVENQRSERSRLFLIANPTFSNVGYDAQSIADTPGRPVLRLAERSVDLQLDRDLMESFPAE